MGRLAGGAVQNRRAVHPIADWIGADSLVTSLGFEEHVASVETECALSEVGARAEHCSSENVAVKTCRVMHVPFKQGVHTPEFSCRP